MAFTLAPLYGQGGSYSAQQDRLLTKANAFSSGVLSMPSATTGDLAVTVGGTSSVNVNSGHVWIPGAANQGFYYAWNDAVIASAQFTSNSSGSNRTDLVYVQVTDTGSGNPTVAVGIQAGSVTVPSNAVGLATVVIPNGFVAGTTNVLAGNITDVRQKARVADLSVPTIGQVASPAAGYVAYDVANTVIKSYSGSAWQQYLRTTDPTWVNGSLTYAPTVISTSANAPTPLAEGLMWYQTDKDRLLVYDGSAWIRLAQSASGGRTGVQVETGSVSYANNARVTINWATETFDSDGFIVAGQVAPNSESIVVPSGLGGLYVATLSVWGTSGAIPVSFTCMIQTNQAPYQAVMAGPSSSSTTGYPALGTNTQYAGTTAMFYCVAGDAIQARVYQNSGSSMSVSARLSVFRIGA